MIALKIFTFLSIVVSTIAYGYKSLQSSISMPYKASDLGVAVYSKSLDSYGPRIYVTGGCVTDQLCTTAQYQYCYCTLATKKCKYFTPENPSWHDCADAPTARTRHMTAIVGDYLYVIGGKDGTVNDNMILDIEVLDIKQNTWSTFATQTTSQAVSDGYAFSYGNQFYVVGGYDSVYTAMSAMLAYDTTASKTSFGAQSPTTMAPMSIGRGDIGMTQLGNNFYVTGGWDSNWCTALKVVEKYDPSADTWSTQAPMLYGRGDMVTGHLDGNMFSIAGEQKFSPTNCDLSVPVSYVGRYDPSSNSWATEEDLSLSVFRFGGASYESDTQKAIFLFGGQTTFNPNLGPYGGYAIIDTVYQYVPYSVASNFGLTSGQIAGIVIGILAFFTCCFGFATMYLLHMRRKHYNKRDIEMGKRLAGGDDNDDTETEVSLSLAVVPGARKEVSL